MTPTSAPIYEPRSKLSGAYSDEKFYDNVQVNVEGEFLPAIQDRFDPAVGLEVPIITGVDLYGSPISVRSEGQTTIIIVLAHWCPHCRNEVRELASYFIENPVPEGIRILSLATSIDSSRANYPPHEWFANEGWPIPVIVDNSNSDIARAIGVSSFPFYVVIDSTGNVSLRIAGRIGVERLERLFAFISTKAY
ncbi:MAG: TlpA disulfide reductase family protein [Chloroflexota bacterium]|nr:TlpA disulfide reductase family protein [Chloroflexota bacterium]